MKNSEPATRGGNLAGHPEGGFATEGSTLHWRRFFAALRLAQNDVTRPSVLKPLLVIVCLVLFALSDSALAKQPAKEREAVADVKAESGPDNRGVELGQYRIRSYYPVDAQKSTVRFTLYATIKDDHLRQSQQMVEEHRQKIRDLVTTATRLAPLAVFQEPDLAAFRRRILVRLRRALPELAIDDLYVSDFDLVIKSL